MRAFFALFVLGLVSIVCASGGLSPRQVAGYPACAQSCLANAKSTKCLSGEVQCLCEDTDFINNTTACFLSSCSGSDLQTAEDTARKNCALAGVTLSSTSTPAGSATSSPSSTASSKPNGADSTMVNIIGGAAALGLAVLAL
ncbi:hypothetical protein BC826DRAFT_558394 [Russula brevipes]|nr:hypothetical protein BC826DRAFT_558394 [Russula brevipes]